MKNLLLGATLIACALGCKSNSNQAVTDPNSANMPKAECTKGACDGSKCEGMKTDGAKPACCEASKKPQG
jgi:hypothetical protein